MSIAGRALHDPLDAVRQRERWLLDALQSRLAAATIELRKARDRHEASARALQAAAAGSLPRPGSVIEPDEWQRRLRHLGEQQGKVATAVSEVAALDASLEQLRLAVMKQQMRFESIERHRTQSRRAAAMDEARLVQVEADRDCLARIGWRQHAGEPPPMRSPPSDDVRGGGR